MKRTPEEYFMAGAGCLLIVGVLLVFAAAFAAVIGLWKWALS